MKKTMYPGFVLIVVIALVLSACGSTATPAATATSLPTSAPAATNTTAPSPSDTPAPTATSVPPTATATVAVESTATPASTETQAASSAACNAMEFVSDVTIPDMKVIASDLSFIKTWAVKNTGSCTWTTDYSLVFSGGFNMFGPEKLNLSQPVAPGETANISIKLVVPSNSGVYQAQYKLADAQGNVFGAGSSGDPLVVRIRTAVTPTPSLGYAVTSVTVTVDKDNATASCPPGQTFNFSANITVNGRGQVTYHWVFSDGSVSGTEPLMFNAAGSHTVTTSWTVGDSGAPSSTNPYKGWAALYVDIPNNASMGQASFNLTCK